MKYKVTLLITLLCAVFFTFPVSAQKSTRQQKKDSLRQVIARTDGKERNRARQQLVSLYVPEVQKKGVGDTVMALCDSLEMDADRLGDVGLREMTKLNKLNILFNMLLYDELIEKAPSVLVSIAQNEQWKYYYQAANLLVDSYRRKGNYEKALEEAKRFYNEAKERAYTPGMGITQLALAKIYSNQQRFVDAEKCSRECIALLEDDRGYFNYLATAYNRLTYSLIGQERFDDALEVARATEAVNLRYEEASHSPQPSAWYNLWLAYIDIYRQSEKFNLAQLYVDKVDSITHGSVKLYKERGHILYGLGRYNEALEVLDQAIATSNGKQEAEGLKLMTFTRMGEPEKALEQFCRVIAEMDSSRNDAFNARLDEVRTQYEVDKYIAQRERNRLYFLFALGGCLFLAILLGVAFYYNRVVTRKNIGLYKRIKEQDRLEEELARMRVQQEEEMQQEAEGASEASVTPDVPVRTKGEMLSGNQQQRKLVERLREYLLQDNNLSCAELNRDELISALGVNKNILSDAVKIITGKTLMEYIRSVQLDEARRLLDGHSELTIEAVAFNCGFNTPSTFYRLFRKQYGISPSEYRKIAKEQALRDD